MDGYGPVIAAAVAGGGDALASKQGHQILPIVPSSGPGELAGGAPSLTLQQQQSSDLYTWLFGNTPPPVDKTASPRASDAPPEDSQTQNLGLASSQTAAGLSPAAGLDAAAQALPGLPVAAMERQASQLVQQETTAERCLPWSPRPGLSRSKHLHSPQTVRFSNSSQTVRFRESPLPLDKRSSPVQSRPLLAGYRWGPPASPPLPPFSPLPFLVSTVLALGF